MSKRLDQPGPEHSRGDNMREKTFVDEQYNEALKTINEQANELESLRVRIRELEAWKESAISTTPPLQEIGKELGVGLGQSIHDKILPGIVKLKAQLADLKKRVHTQYCDKCNHKFYDENCGQCPKCAYVNPSRALLLERLAANETKSLMTCDAEQDLCVRLRVDVSEPPFGDFEWVVAESDEVGTFMLGAVKQVNYDPPVWAYEVGIQSGHASSYESAIRAVVAITERSEHDAQPGGED